MYIWRLTGDARHELGLSSQITSASYSLKMAYKKCLFPFEEHHRTNNDKGDVTDDGVSPLVKSHNEQSGDGECGSTTSTKSSNVDYDADQSSGPPPAANHDDDDDDDDNSTQEDAMDTTDE